jgi:hypothetical protein
MYLLVQRDDNDEKLYIHFDSNTQAYLLGDSRVGACLFTESGANVMLREINSQANNQDRPAWVLEIAKMEPNVNIIKC